jgi:hypothetical protein
LNIDLNHFFPTYQLQLNYETKCKTNLGQNIYMNDIKDDNNFS